MICKDVGCESCIENDELSELCCVRCALKDEIKDCKACEIDNNKLKKANGRLPDDIADDILLLRDVGKQLMQPKINLR